AALAGLPRFRVQLAGRRDRRDADREPEDRLLPRSSARERAGHARADAVAPRPALLSGRWRPGDLALAAARSGRARYLGGIREGLAPLGALVPAALLQAGGRPRRRRSAFRAGARHGERARSPRIARLVAGA